MTMKLPSYLSAILEESGHTWSIDERKKHSILRIDGRAVLTMPRPGRSYRDAGRQHVNAAATVRRFLRGDRT